MRFISKRWRLQMYLNVSETLRVGHGEFICRHLHSDSFTCKTSPGNGAGIFHEC